MIIALFPNEKKSLSYDLATEICKFLEKKGIQVVAESEKAKRIGARSLDSVNADEIQFLIAMGGDGTLLRITHHYKHINAPILGINLGHLGFMADIPIEDIYPSLNDLLSGKFDIEHRIALEGSSENGQLYAVNDLVFHRAQNYSLIELGIHIDGIYLNTFVADGVIIATPNGSTAYSLSAGGPILSPSLQAIVITPICPHTISNRPIVLTPDHTIEIQYLSQYDPIDVRADGLKALTLHSQQKVIIQQSQKKFKLVTLHRHEYFSTLRSKLGWSGKLR